MTFNTFPVEKSQFMKRGGARQSACPQNSKLLPQSHSGGLKTSLTLKFRWTATSFLINT
uniref:Uncharacterized protein n=1 Tax=Rhizobium rhizogenes TaxID=359 RepID=A0A7S5DRH1_RHIRH|nr:hypothetical protein pC5.8a_149 [Rhizobium rhizogenes]